MPTVSPLISSRNSSEDISDETILSYLKEENAYFEQAMAPARPLVDTLFAEMKGRMKEDDASVPRKDGDWDSWWAFETGAQYRRWLRRPSAGSIACFSRGPAARRLPRANHFFP